MELAGFLQENRILLSPESKTKEALLKEMVLALYPEREELSAVVERVLEREQIKSTGFGKGLAVAHARIETLTDLELAVARPKEPVEWAAADGQPVVFIVLVLGPHEKDEKYLQILSEITKIWARKETQALLLSAQTPSEVIQIISQAKSRTHPR